jgi:trigger factor
MQVSVETGEGLERKLSVQLPAEQVDQMVESKLAGLARTVRMDGFRPGKVPLRVVRQRFGEQVRAEVYGELIQQTFPQAAQREQLKPAGEPRIEVAPADDGSFSYVATFDVMPEIELADVAGLEVARPMAEVVDADVDAMIDKLRRQRTEWDRVERTAADGDSVLVDFEGFLDGEPFQGGSAKQVTIVLGSGQMIPGFEEALVGVAAGDQRTLELTFPDDYRATELAGKPVRFEVAVHGVAEPRLPELDEEFIKSFGVGEGTEDALRAEVRSNMERELRQKIKSLVKERVMDALLAANDLIIPAAMVTREAEVLKRQAQQNMSGKSSVDLPLEVFQAQAERRVKLGLLVGEILQREQLQADPQRVEQTIAELAEAYEDPREVIEWYRGNAEQRQAVENLVLEDSVVDWVLERASVSDEAGSFEALMGGELTS